MSRLLPFFAFLGLVVLFGFGIWWNTKHDQREVPSPLIGRAAPEFRLPVLDDPDRTVAKADLLGKPYLLNVFGSWCFACGEEHPVLMAEGKALGVMLVGYNYKDEPAAAKGWLAEHGNPYDLVIADVEGRTAIDFGVYGAPETFLVDGKGVIRYKRVGPLTPDVIEREVKPALAAIAKESP